MNDKLTIDNSPLTPKAVPALRFPEFLGEWKPTTLGRECICLDNKRIPLKEGDRSKRRGAYPYYGASGIIDTIDDYLFDETLVLLAEDGANIIMRNSPIAFLAEGKYWVNNHAHVYRAKGSPVFLATYLENLRYEKYNTGTAQPKLNGETCKKLKLNFPSLPEQQKIASFLSAVDSKIEQLGRKKQLLEHYKKGMMQKLFSQELRFKDAQGNDFPDWEEKRLGEVATFAKGKGISKNDISADGATPCIRYGQLYTDYAETISEIKSCTNAPKSNLVLSRQNDVIIPASGETALDIATASCVTKDGVALGGDLNIIRSSVNGVFLAYNLNSYKKIDIAHLAQGISVVHLYASQLKTLSLEIPCAEEQQKITDFLSAIDQKIDLVATELDHAKTLKKGLLQQMFV